MGADESRGSHSTSMDWGTFPFPALKRLALDGWNFVNLFRNAPHWLDSFVTMKEPDLSVSHFRQAEVDDLGRFSFNDAWPIFSRVACLELENLDFDCIFGPESEELWSEHRYIGLTDLSGKLTAVILLNTAMCTSLDITRCPLGRITNLPSPYELTFDEIDDGDSICRLLTRWRGGVLHMQNCPGFNDDVLEMLGEASYYDEEHSTFNASNLFQLRLENCHNFSTLALREMVERRIEALINEPEQELTKICTISGQNVPALRQEDRDWLTETTSLEWEEEASE